MQSMIPSYLFDAAQELRGIALTVDNPAAANRINEIAEMLEAIAVRLAAEQTSLERLPVRTGVDECTDEVQVMGIRIYACVKRGVERGERCEAFLARG